MTISANYRYFYSNGRPIVPKPPELGGRGHTTAQPLCTDYHCPLSSSGAHHYMLAGQDGPTSTGECRYCGLKKDFVNSWSEAKKDNQGARR